MTCYISPAYSLTKHAAVQPLSQEDNLYSQPITAVYAIMMLHDIDVEVRHNPPAYLMEAVLHPHQHMKACLAPQGPILAGHQITRAVLNVA